MRFYEAARQSGEHELGNAIQIKIPKAMLLHGIIFKHFIKYLYSRQMRPNHLDDPVIINTMTSLVEYLSSPQIKTFVIHNHSKLTRSGDFFHWFDDVMADYLGVRHETEPAPEPEVKTQPKLMKLARKKGKELAEKIDPEEIKFGKKNFSVEAEEFKDVDDVEMKHYIGAFESAFNKSRYNKVLLNRTFYKDEKFTVVVGPIQKHFSAGLVHCPNCNEIQLVEPMTLVNCQKCKKQFWVPDIKLSLPKTKQPEQSSALDLLPKDDNPDPAWST